MKDKVKLYDEAFAKLSKKAKVNTKDYILFMIEYSTLLYKYIHEELEPKHLEDDKCEKEIRMMCVRVAKEIYPNLIKNRDLYCESKKVEQTIVDLFNRVEDDLYSIMALRNLKYFAYYVDRDKIPKQRIWERGTMEIFESYYFYCNRMILDNTCDMVRASFFPGAGKSYAGNLTTAFWLGYCPTMTFLRITYNDDLTKSFVRQTCAIIKGKRFKKVFPKFDVPDKELFTIDNSTSFQLKFSHTLNLVGTTSLGKGTGFRAKVLMLDDIVKGVQDAYNVEMQQKIVNMYDNEWTSRADDSEQKIIALGTMWSCYDLLNVIQKRALKSGVFEHPRYKYCLCDSDDPRLIRRVFISTPLLDFDTDESTCPKRFTTEYARKKRDEAEDKDMFEAVYQQNPQEPEELLFAYGRLHCYRVIPFDPTRVEYETMAMIDPVREGQNYFAMPILRRFKKEDGTWSKFYLIDAICKFQTNDFCMPFVVDKMVRHKIEWVGYEKNVDASWIKLLRQELTKHNYTSYRVKNIYTTKNKDMKISTARNGVLNDIIYPAQGLFSPKSEIGIGMIQLTTWQFMGRNKFDDFPDAIAMFVIENPTKKKFSGNGFSPIERVF